MNDDESYIKRLRYLLIFFGVWALLAAGRLFYFSVLERDKYISDSTRLAWRVGSIPVVRGKILTADGIPLAWSEYQVRLTLVSFPEKTERKKALLKFIKEEFGKELTGEEKLPFTLIQLAEINAFQKLHTLVKPYPDLRCALVMIRKRHPDKSLDGVIGFCRRLEDGTLEGVSGLEKKYETELRGRTGKFRVMLNRYGNFVNATLRIYREALPGKDVTLSQTFESFRKENEEK